MIQTIGTTGNFVFLHTHTAEGSLLDSILPNKRLVEKAKEMGHSAVAITNHGKMHDFVEFYKHCEKNNIKPIIGNEIYEVEDLDNQDTIKNRYHLLLLAKNEKGLKNLFKISSDGHTKFFYYKPLVDLKYIKENNLGDGIICLTACQAGRLSRGLVKGQDMTQYVDELENIFDDVYLEIQSHDTIEQQNTNQKIIEFAKNTNRQSKLVITTDAHMENKEDVIIHDIFVEISQDREVGESYSGCYMQTTDEIHSIMDKQVGKNIVEIGIENTIKISEMINKIDIGLNNSFQMPDVSKHMPKNFKSIEEWYNFLIEEGYKKRKHDLKDKDFQNTRKERLQKEYPVLKELKYLDYFIMLYLLLNEAKQREIPLGFARGSAAGSLSAYYLGITDIDSVRWDLDFTRFANLGRIQMADVDLDISKKHRKELVQISKEMFGEDYVAPIATFNTMSTKVAIRDIGAVLDRKGIYNIPYEIRDSVAKAIPTIKTIDDLGEDVEKEILLKDLMASSDKLSSYYEKYPLWFEYVMRLEGLPKSLGQHAAGVIISPKPIIEYCPLCLNKDKEPMLQVEMHNAMDDLKLIKMDYLGLKTLDVINDTLHLLGKKWSDLSVDDIDFEDKNVYETIYKNGKTIGVFQMESFEARNMCVDCNTDNIEDIIAVNAFNRPATKDNFPIYVKNKAEPNKVKVAHEDLKDIFGKTHYVLLYQEQALSMFRHAGFPDERTDLARRAIGKKETETMKSLKSDFEKGLKNKGWKQPEVDEVWQLMLKQADYSFNRSHSCSYGILSYLTAYFKYHYPAEFFASALNNEEDNGKMSKLIHDAKFFEIQVKKPSINKSQQGFYPIDKTGILFGFSSIKGLGDKSLEKLLKGRPYKDLEDFIDRSEINIAQQVILAKSGALGRPQEAFEQISSYKFTKDYKSFLPRKSVTPKDLKDKFNIEIPTTDKNFKEKRIEVFNNLSYQLYEKQRRRDREKCLLDFKEKYYSDPMGWEFETMSMFITFNPFEKALKILDNYDKVENGSMITVVGIITNVTKKKDKNGKPFAFVDLFNGERNMEVSFWARDYARYQNGIKIGSRMAIFGRKNTNGLEILDIKPYKKWVEEKGL
jgi:DNA polymerase-3 subunit alpha